MFLKMFKFCKKLLLDFHCLFHHDSVFVSECEKALLFALLTEKKHPSPGRKALIQRNTFLQLDSFFLGQQSKKQSLYNLKLTRNSNEINNKTPKAI